MQILGIFFGMLGCATNLCQKMDGYTYIFQAGHLGRQSRPNSGRYCTHTHLHTELKRGLSAVGTVQRTLPLARKNQ